MEKKYEFSEEELQNLLEAAAKKAVKEYAAGKKTSLISRKATAKRLGVDVSTLWRWSKRKYLIPVVLAGRVYYREADVIRREGGYLPEA